MAFNLIGSVTSTCSQRVLTVLAEKGVTDFNLIRLDFSKAEHKQPPHTAKQPFGLIPVLEHGDFILAESRAICKYLATLYADQGTKLVPDPTDLKATARFDQWASIEFADFDPYASGLAIQKIFNVWKGLQPVPEVVKFHIDNLSAKLDIYNGILEKQKYMGGDEFSLVDIFYLPYTQKLFESGDGNLITDRPYVKAWWERVSSRESWKGVLALSQKK